MLGIVIPVHNEEAWLASCLQAVVKAAASPKLHRETVHTLVVLDSCTDGSACIAASFGIPTLQVQARNVGIARATGAQRCLEMGVRWLAFTDADTLVSPDWLAEQLDQRSDAVCGTVAVNDWSGHAPHLALRFKASYNDAHGHRHIHGANLGVSAQAYRDAGGFPPLACSEDVALVQALQARGASIAWSAAPRVVTSARKNFRAAGGFGATLLQGFPEAGLAGEAAACA
ncbi:glycosyltransferase family 2 protein [Polaromonas sp. CG_9.11]|uniref:glycosyltransferase n=1 Tax=Polaromonas sp. CG_9.11 TaxID=2787730 RepID=UPI000564E14E|nr:glycosyltransferase [Polaromonas sp. CG_9.11]MBG6076247.1 glycosyltransferase involved in cell wall biosynthesis [Polaromonas sp. CG_9.11]